MAYDIYGNEFDDGEYASLPPPFADEELPSATDPYYVPDVSSYGPVETQNFDDEFGGFDQGTVPTDVPEDFQVAPDTPEPVMQAPGGPPSPWDVAGGMGQQGVESDTRALENAQSLATAPRQKIVKSNAMHDPVHQAGDVSRAANDQLVGATLEGQGLDEGYAEELATFSAVESAKAQVVAQQVEESAARRAAQLQAQIERGQEIRKSIDDAANKLASGPDEDPGQYWASKPAYQKIFLVLSAALKGWLQGQGMSVDPMADIREGIQRNLDAQRSNRARLAERMTARERQALSNSNLIDEMTKTFGAEDIAQSAARLAMLQATQKKLQHMAAEYSRDQIPVEAVKFNAALAKEIAEEELKLRAREVANPKQFVSYAAPKLVPYKGKDGKTYYVDPKFARRGAEAELSEGADQRKAAGAQLGKAAEQNTDLVFKHELELLKRTSEAAAAAKGTTADRRLDQMAKHQYYQATHLLKEENNLLSEFKERYSDNVPGIAQYNFGTGWHRWTDEQQAAYDLMHRAVMVRLRKESGAAIGMNEKAEDAEAALALHSDEAHEYLSNLDEDDVLREVDMRLNENKRRLQEATRFMTKEQLEDYHKAEHPGDDPSAIPTRDPQPEDDFGFEVEE